MESVTGKGSGAAFILRMGVYERPNTPEDYEDEKLKSYHRAADIDIAFNTFVDCANDFIIFGKRYQRPEGNPGENIAYVKSGVISRMPFSGIL